MSTPDYQQYANQLYTLSGTLYKDWQIMVNNPNPTATQMSQIQADVNAVDSQMYNLWVAIRGTSEPTPEAEAALLSLGASVHDIHMQLNYVVDVDIQNKDYSGLTDALSLSLPNGSDSLAVTAFRNAIKLGAAEVDDLYQAWLKSPNQANITAMLAPLESFANYLSTFGGPSKSTADRAGALGLSIQAYNNLIMQLLKADGDCLGIQSGGGNSPPNLIADLATQWGAALSTLNGSSNQQTKS
jgi:hypothetical protein